MDKEQAHRMVRTQYGFALCTKCGLAEHRNKFEGFKFWHAGDGYSIDPGCQVKEDDIPFWRQL